MDNPHFRPPPESDLADDEVRRRIRAEFTLVRSHFIDRLGCAQVFDRALFDALLLWLDTLHRSYQAADLPLPHSLFTDFPLIESFLQQEATYSRGQRTECSAALAEWRDTMNRHKISSEHSP